MFSCTSETAQNVNLHQNTFVDLIELAMELSFIVHACLFLCRSVLLVIHYLFKNNNISYSYHNHNRFLFPFLSPWCLVHHSCPLQLALLLLLPLVHRLHQTGHNCSSFMEWFRSSKFSCKLKIDSLRSKSCFAFHPSFVYPITGQLAFKENSV